MKDRLEHRLHTLLHGRRVDGLAEGKEQGQGGDRRRADGESLGDGGGGVAEGIECVRGLPDLRRLIVGGPGPGDTLFPGGPGHSNSPEELQQNIVSITGRLYTLPDDTLVLPGHGDNTTIEGSRKEYAVFASRSHPRDLHGDVLWESS